MCCPILCGPCDHRLAWTLKALRKVLRREILVELGMKGASVVASKSNKALHRALWCKALETHERNAEKEELKQGSIH